MAASVEKPGTKTDALGRKDTIALPLTIF